MESFLVVVVVVVVNFIKHQNRAITVWTVFLLFNFRVFLEWRAFWLFNFGVFLQWRASFGCLIFSLESFIWLLVFMYF